MNLARGVRIVLGPDTHEFVEMMGAEDGRVARQIIEVVHDDGDEEIEHEEGAEEDETDEVSVGEVRAALVARLLGARVAGLLGYAGQHDVRPGLARRASFSIGGKVGGRHVKKREHKDDMVNSVGWRVTASLFIVLALFLFSFSIIFCCFLSFFFFLLN